MIFHLVAVSLRHVQHVALYISKWVKKGNKKELRKWL